jgi:hypothetical protein
VLGEANSRMRDFFAIFALAKHEEFGDVLVQAIRATFERRRTPIPGELPFALTPGFSALPAKREQWRGFLRKNRLVSVPVDLTEVKAFLAGFSRANDLRRATQEDRMIRPVHAPQNRGDAMEIVPPRFELGLRPLPGTPPRNFTHWTLQGTYLGYARLAKMM